MPVNQLPAKTFERKRKPLPIHYYKVVAPTPIETPVETFQKRTLGKRRSAAYAAANNAPASSSQATGSDASRPLEANYDQLCDNCGCNNEDVKYWVGDMQFAGQIHCNTCGSYFRDHVVSRPEKDWDLVPPRQAFYYFQEPNDSPIPDTLRIHDPRHKRTTFLEAYTHHLRITLEVRHYLEESFEEGRPPPRPRWRYKIGDKRIAYGASIQHGHNSTYDFL